MWDITFLDIKDPPVTVIWDLESVAVEILH